MKITSKLCKEIGILASIAQAYNIALIGFQGARIAILNTRFEIQREEDEKRSDGYDPRLPNLMTNVVLVKMLIVYSCSVFDSFLNDITKFLYYTNPEDISGELKISVSDLVTSRRASAALGRELSRKAKEISFHNIVERINHINKTFTLSISFEDGDMKTIKEYMTIRNSFVHSHDIVELNFGRDFNISQELKNTNVELFKDMNAILTRYSDIMAKIYDATWKKYALVVPDEFWAPYSLLIRFRSVPENEEQSIIRKSREAENKVFRSDMMQRLFYREISKSSVRCTMDYYQSFLDIR